MTEKQRAENRRKRIVRERIQRARELIAYADLNGITIGWEGEFTTFHPADSTPGRFMQEATILSTEIKALKEGRIK